MANTIYHVFISCLFHVIHCSFRLWFIIVDLKFPWRKTKKKYIIHKIFKPCCWGLHGSRMLRWYQKWSGNSHGFESQFNTMTSMVQATLPQGGDAQTQDSYSENLHRTFIFFFPWILMLDKPLETKTWRLETFHVWPNKDILKLEITA